MRVLLSVKVAMLRTCKTETTNVNVTLVPLRGRDTRIFSSYRLYQIGTNTTVYQSA